MFFRNVKFSRNNNFDFLRFLLALIVVCEHCIILSGSTALSVLSPFFDAHMAVCGFFVISGFLVTKSYLSTNNGKIYFQKRARRVLPAYLLVIVLCVLLLPIIGDLSYGETLSQPQTLKYFLSNIVFLNFLEPNLPGVFSDHHLTAVDGALWTIKIEVAFYFLLPLIIWGVNRAKKPRLGLFLVLFIYFVSVLFRIITDHYGRLLDMPLLTELSHQLPAYLCYFLSGSVLLMLYDSFKKVQHKIAALALIVYVLEYWQGFEVLRPIALAILVVYIAFNFRGLNNFGKYGDISYGIYIFHFPIIQTLIHFHFYDQNPFFKFLITIILVCLVGFLSWHLVEKRFLSAQRLRQ